ncbi:MAG TPA: glycosyltransferase [Candidatus Diapherotrites archaeon]|uniref:Glycosyltransferase n=1 Tax=Candidatus Iainarchaeum sp. TaxID=3101447 RepID=A0A7J4IWQ2_9ARCH|nr:glycosyltransferase [Candidatus Diapherotrites archaeon]
MRIYYASQSFYPHVGGVSTYLLNLASSMIRNGHEVVEVHLRTPGDRSEEEIKGVEVKRVPREPIDKSVLDGYYQFKDAIYSECHYGSGKFPLPASQVPGFDEYSKVNHYFGEQLKELLEDKAADIVHIHDFQLLFAYKYVPRGTPLVLTWHIPFQNSISPHLSKFLIKNMRQYDKVIFSTSNYIDAAVRAGLPKEKAELVYPITDSSLFTPDGYSKWEAREKLGLGQNEKIILSVQRIDQKSGHEQLIRAMPKVLGKVPDAMLVFVGSESMSNKISRSRDALKKNAHNLIKQLGLEGRVRFMGNIDYPKMPLAYHASDVTALCSRNEGFGLAITEAMLCGRAVIGNKIGGIPEQVKDGKNGYLVEVGDFDTTARRLVSLLQNEGIRKRMEAAQPEFTQKFSTEASIEKHMRIYNKLKSEKDELYKLRSLPPSEISGFILDFDRTLTNKPARAEFNPQDVDPGLLEELRGTGIRLFLATGRDFEYVRRLCRDFNIWTCAIAENGAVIYIPSVERTITIDTGDMERARSIIAGLGLEGTTAGKVITSVKARHERVVRKALGGLCQKLTFEKNVDDLLVMPIKVGKGYGARIALQYFNIDIEKTIVAGDSENDVSMFMNPGFKVALANSHWRLKELAHQTMKSASAQGIREMLTDLFRPPPQKGRLLLSVQDYKSLL